MTHSPDAYGWKAVVVGLTVLVSAFLLFQVQPITAKYILPWFGGTPAVWTTCMLFFQVLLLAGYCYAHLLVRFPPRVQVLAHLGVTILALLCLPLSLDNAHRPTGHESPPFHILSILATSVGFPYFVLAASAPLLQAWHARGFPAASAYRLYSLSNVGSLAALLTYPFLVEPLLGVVRQTEIWSLGFLFFGLLIVSSALISQSFEWRICPTASGGKSQLGQIALWFTLAAVASTLLLAITNHICQDVAVVPFLWVAPLSLYLLSFILCFESTRWYQRRWYIPVLAGLVLLLCDPQFSGPQADIRVAVIVPLATLFVACMVCHGELVALRPPAHQLTAFYVALSAGGAGGGVFVALVAPALFNSFVELDLALFILALCLALISYQEWAGGVAGAKLKRRLLGLLAALTLLGYVLGAHGYKLSSGAIVQTRNFYGVLRLSEEFQNDPARHIFAQYHGRILHGFQFTAPQKRALPQGYYGPQTGAGLTLRLFPRSPKSIGMIGLGVGTLAAYGQPGDSIRFYEINPAVIAQTTNHFSYLKESAAQISLVAGDARLSLERERSHNFDILVLDAFSGDAIPAHLLTAEAFAIYRRHLKADGVIAVHISNSHLDLRPVVAGAAQFLGMRSAVVHSAPDEGQGHKNCDWMLLSTNDDFFSVPEIHQFVDHAGTQREELLLWTDAHNDLVSILK